MGEAICAVDARDAEIAADSLYAAFVDPEYHERPGVFEDEGMGTDRFRIIHEGDAQGIVYGIGNHIATIRADEAFLKEGSLLLKAGADSFSLPVSLLRDALKEIPSENKSVRPVARAGMRM